MYIKLDENMNLVITVSEPLYKGDRRNRNIIFLIPHTIGKVDTASSTIYMCYMRPDEATDVALLDRCNTPYNKTYDQYVIPVKGALTHISGNVVMWIEIYSETEDGKPIFAKSGDTVIPILEAKNINISPDIGCEDDTQLTMFQQLWDAIDDKADGLSYNDETYQLSLKSGAEDIGTPVIVGNAEESDNDYWYRIDEVPVQDGGII